MIKKTTVFDPQRSLFVKRSFELYAKNDISLRALRQRLYDEGYIYLPSNPKISVAQLERMLKNDCYTGYGHIITGITINCLKSKSNLIFLLRVIVLIPLCLEM